MGFVTKDSGQREQFDTGAKRDTRTGKGRFDLLPIPALRQWAELMERGAIKYGERNWQSGMPISRCLDSAMRHLLQLMNSETDEAHGAAVLFNVGAVIYYLDAIEKGLLPPEIDDRWKPIKQEEQ